MKDKHEHGARFHFLHRHTKTKKMVAITVIACHAYLFGV